MRCCARRCTTTCCPGERGELHIALARELEQRCGADDDRELERASAIAGHYAAAGDQPHALRGAIAAARAAHTVYAYGEAADFTERALELWPRVDEPEQVAGLDHVRLLTMAAEAHQTFDDRARSVTLINEALRELDPEVDPARYAGLLARQARIVWALNRGEEALAIAERALAMLPEDDPGAERPRLLAWLARMRYLRGRFRHAASEGQAALEVAVAAGDRLAETELLNTLGMAYVSLGDVEKGIRSLRRAIALARADRRLRQPGHGVLQPRRQARGDRSDRGGAAHRAGGTSGHAHPSRAQLRMDEAHGGRDGVPCG